MVQHTDGVATSHLAADGIPDLCAIDSFLAHRKPLAFDFYLQVPRTLVSGVTDFALQTTCGPRNAVKKAVSSGKEASGRLLVNMRLLRASYSPIYTIIIEPSSSL